VAAPPSKAPPSEAPIPGAGSPPTIGEVWHECLKTEAGRELLAETLGFDQVGAPIPDHVTLKNVIDSFPKEVFELNPWKAWRSVAISVSSMAACLWLISVVPPVLLPVAWFVAGTAFTGWFVVGHDCGHRSFCKTNWVEDLVGILMFMPLIYPFEPWRLKHDQHHAFTNQLVHDTAWHPLMPEEVEAMPPLARRLVTSFLGSPFKLVASIGHWLQWHFDLSLYTKQQLPKVKLSLATTFLFMFGALPLITLKLGVWGLVKYWLMPWLGFHFWLSAFTLIHHTAPHIPFKGRKEWNAAQAQLGGTVHCEFPKWVEVLCHDISVHIPHHCAMRIPSYNLRAAHESLEKNWGPHLNKTSLPKHWKLLLKCCSDLHVYDRELNYVSFDAAVDSHVPKAMLQGQRWAAGPEQPDGYQRAWYPSTPAAAP